MTPHPSNCLRTCSAWIGCALLVALLAGCGGGGGAADPNASASSSAPSSSTADAAAPADDAASSALGATTSSLALAVSAEQLAADAAAQAAAAAVQTEAQAAAATDPTTPANALAVAVESTTLTQALAASNSAAPVLTVRARASLAGGVGAAMTVRINGSTIGTATVNSTSYADYKFPAPTLGAGAKVDIVFTNDAVINGEDRNLYIGYLADASQTLLPTLPGAIFDRGSGNQAFDGLDTLPGQGDLYWNGALRLTWPAAAGSASTLTNARLDAARFLQQASFGARSSDIDALVSKGQTAWLNEQMALPVSTDFVAYVQAKYNLGAAYRPGGSSYTPAWVGQQFWAGVANRNDQLRLRTTFALHQIFMISQADSNLYYQARAYANYLDTLNRNAFGNFRTLLEDMALSPAMGIYLSHLRNRKEDAATGRVPDENFAREVMQLFTIGLYELNNDGSLKRDSAGNPIETYGNADVMALAKVFTGWSWAYPDNQLTDSVFRWSTPSTAAGSDSQIDLLPMKAYPGQHSTAAKTLFAGKSWATTLPANGTAATDLKLALDALFRHPNVGPFIGRQLIQHLVTSNPTPAYVNRVANVFNNNGSGVRGDLAAVVRAILLDAEARSAPATGFGKLREPVLRVAQWMRAMGVKSSTGDYMMAWELDNNSERVMYAPSVFGYFRPGYIPPNTSFATTRATAPEFQLVNESTVAAWINTAEAMAGTGLGWTGSANDVAADYAVQATLASGANLNALIDHINLVLLGGRMTATTRQALLDAAIGVGGSGATANLYRARAAVFMALASPEYMVQQ